MKKLLTLLLMYPLFLSAQKLHTVAAKESFSSIGRLYSINGRELASFNKLDYGIGLSVGQVLKIPSNATIAKPEIKTETKTNVATEVSKNQSNPIYHTVNSKETFYSISKMYKQATPTNLKKWNKKSETDGLSVGEKLIVGYESKKANIETSSIASPIKTSSPEPSSQPEANPQPSIQVPMEITKTPIPQTLGYFAAEFKVSNHPNIVVGKAGIFKSTSGWSDEKYYCLHNYATIGSIVKITNTANNKSVYAKVLDVIPDLEQNKGIMLRISNAAVDAILASGSSFECEITY